MKPQPVLVACANYAGKEPLLGRWADCYKALTYRPKQAYMVDNTIAGDGFLRAIRAKGIPATRIVPSRSFEVTYRRCWELILERARQIDAYWIVSIEADNTVSEDAIEIMLNWVTVGDGKVGGLEQNIHMVTHAYGMHPSAAAASGVEMDSFHYYEMGCAMFSRQLLEQALANWEEFRNLPRALFECCERFGGRKLYLSGCFEVTHDDCFETEFWQFDPQDTTMPDGGLLTCPAPVAPASYGTKVPECLSA